jgi:hypothetical protein
MNLPITKKEYDRLIELLSKSGEQYKQLYTKLWSHKMNYLNKEQEHGLS